MRAGAGVGLEQVADQVTIRVVPPEPDLFTCTLPDGDKYPFAPQQFGVVLDITNSSDHILVVDLKHTAVVLEVADIAIPVLGNPIRELASTAMGHAGLGGWSTLFESGYSYYENLRQQAAEQDLRAYEAALEEARQKEQSRQAEIEKLVVAKEPIPPSLMLPIEMPEPPPEDSSGGGPIMELVKGLEDALTNPGRAMLFGQVAATYDGYASFTLGGDTSPYDRYHQQVSGSYKTDWERWAQQESMRERSVDPNTAPVALMDTFNTTLSQRYEGTRLQALESIEAGRSACMDKLRMSLNAYGEWPPTILPGYSRLFFVPFGPVEGFALLADGGMTVSVYDMPVSFGEDGSVTRRQNFHFPMVVEPMLGLAELP